MDNKNLTNREEEVAKLLCKGLTNKEIAKVLIISITTAKAHVNAILRKLNVKNRTLAAYNFGKNHTFDNDLNTSTGKA